MRTASIIVVAVVGSGAWLSACSKAQVVAPKTAQPVKTQTVTVAPPQGGVRYSVTIEPLEQVQLAFKTTGYVDDLLRRPGADGRQRAAQAGDRVTKGTVLARVRESDYRERLSQGKAKLAEGEASLTRARLNLERAKTLFAADSLTKPDLDTAQADFDASDARVTAARADIELAQIALNDCALLSPTTGIVLERRVEVGTLAAAGTVGFVLGDLSSVKARFGIPDGMIQAVRLGESIGVTVEAIAATTFSGQVTAVAPAADPQSRVFDVEVTIPNKDGRLRPGMIGTVAIGQADSRMASAEGPLAVPLAAIVRSANSSSEFAVLVVQQQNGVDVARRRGVELGSVIGNTIAVLKGLTPGDRVVVSGASLLVDGDPVRVMH
jgi:multidrug efflux system membrane fusion protein